jgi:hypothetical protein
MGQSRVVGMLIGVLLVIAVIWFSMWLGDLPRCGFTPTMRIGGSMVVAGCK